MTRLRAFDADLWVPRAVGDAGTAGIRPADTVGAAVIAHIHMASRAAAMPYPPPQKRGHDQVTRWAEDVLLRTCHM
ncbi:hypothetical protein [Streptomyces sp. NPDC057496]|uniref:hypothetical protein n=1 Tax=Streptomyces sp. NPDC057496 TaxID=3346149 RepID=UPI0036A1AB17